MAGFPSQYSPELWQQARDLIAQGFTFPEVADKTGIGLSNLKMKSQRESWFVPVTAIQKGREAMELREKEKEVCPSVTTEAVLAESIAEIGQKGQIHALRGMLPRFMKTFDQDSELLSKPVEDWKTAGSMVNIFSKLAGLDKPQIAIQSNVFNGDWTASDGVREAEEG